MKISRILLLVPLVVTAMSCTSVHRWKYERLMLQDDIHITVGGFQFDDQRTIRVSGGHQFESLAASAFAEHVALRGDKRDLAWVVISKPAQWKGWNDELQSTAVSGLREMGFQRIIIQSASSQRGPYIMYDSETED